MLCESRCAAQDHQFQISLSDTSKLETTEFRSGKGGFFLVLEQCHGFVTSLSIVANSDLATSLDVLQDKEREKKFESFLLFLFLKKEGAHFLDLGGMEHFVFGCP